MIELARMIATKAVSPVEVVRAHLDRIAALDPGLRSYITVCDETALAAARAAETTLMAGQPLGPARDATVAARLAGAGAILLGKLNMVEFAYGPEGLNPHYGHARNPWDRGVHRMAGGSSSGSGVAVASGLAMLPVLLVCVFGSQFVVGVRVKR